MRLQLSDRNKPTTESSFDERWYKLAMENLTAEWDQEYQKLWEVPADVDLGSHADLYPGMVLGANMVWNFGKNALSLCLEILQSCKGGGTSDFIRKEPCPRVLREISIRKDKVLKRFSGAMYKADDLQDAHDYLDIKMEQLEKEVRNAFEIEAIKREDRHSISGERAAPQDAHASVAKDAPVGGATRKTLP